jgi:hypothetical protein
MLMLQINEDIHDSSTALVKKAIEDSSDKELLYPPKPDGEFTQNDIEVIKKIKEIPGIQSVLEKIVSDASASVIFKLLNYLDRTGDPSPQFGEWAGVALVDMPDDDSYEGPVSMNHDVFYEAYWDWKEKK